MTTRPDISSPLAKGLLEQIRSLSAGDLRICGAIACIHLLFSLFGWHSFRMDSYMQIAQTNFPVGTPFWEMLFYFHGNPPLLSVIHHIGSTLCGEQGLLFFDLILPLLHIFSFLFFRAALKGFQLPLSIWFSTLLFLNPLIFLYFRYPFYTCFLFFLNSALLYLLSGLNLHPKRIWLIAAVLSTEALLRASYSPILLLALCFFLLPVRSVRAVLGLLLIFGAPFAWQAKNYQIVGKFTSSTWIGMNLARGHLPWNTHNQLVDFIPSFSMPDRYFELLSGHPRVAKCRKETNYFLSQNNLNHAVIPVVSDLYLESIRKEFSWAWSLNTFLNGFLTLFKSPANYPHLRHHIRESWGYDLQGWNPDFWEPRGLKDREFNYLFLVDAAWDPDGSRWQALRRISLYTILYPFLLVYFAWNFFKLPRMQRVVYLLTLFFTLVYAAADVLEANRMRMEYEVFFYFLLAAFWVRWRNYDRFVTYY